MTGVSHAVAAASVSETMRTTRTRPTGRRRRRKRRRSGRTKRCRRQAVVLGWTRSSAGCHRSAAVARGGRRRHQLHDHGTRTACSSASRASAPSRRFTMTIHRAALQPTAAAGGGQSRGGCAKAEEKAERRRKPSWRRRRPTPRCRRQAKAEVGTGRWRETENASAAEDAAATSGAAATPWCCQDGFSDPAAEASLPR